MWQSKPYMDALELQRLISATAPNAEAKDLASLSKSFVALEMLKLRLRMKPAPKPVDVSKVQPKRSATSSPSFE